MNRITENELSQELLNRLNDTVSTQRVSETFVATEGQTTFVLSDYTYIKGVGRTEVYIDGIQQSIKAGHYTEGNDGKTITLNEPLAGGRLVEVFVILGAFPVGNSDGNNADLLTDDKSTKVAAINEVYRTSVRVAEDIAQREINVRQPPYNVNLDGTDETEKIQRALDDLNTVGGGTLIFPKGVYIAEGLVPYSNITIRSHQPGLVTIRRPDRVSTDTPKHIMISLNKNLENFYVENITFDGNYKGLGYVTNGAKPPIQDVMLRNNTKGFSINNIKFSNCRFINGTNEALGIHGTYTDGDISYDVRNIEVSNCEFSDIYGNALFAWGQDIRVIDSVFTNIDDTGIGLDLSTDTIVTGNILKYDMNHKGYKYFNGICGIAGAFYSQKNTIVKDNHVVDYQIGVKVDPVTITTNMSARLALISNNIISSPNRTSAEGLIRVTGGSKIKLAGNIIHAYNNYGHGISVQPNSNSINPDDVIIEHNQIYDTVRAGIYGRAGSDLHIQGNKLVDCGKSGQTFPVDSVYLNGCSDVFVEGNKIKNSGRNSIFLEGCSIAYVSVNYTTQSIAGISNTGVVIKRNFINGKPTENDGFSNFNGDGVKTSFVIPHGVPTARGGVVTPGHAASMGEFYATFDSTNITVVYTTPPPTGTNNVKLAWCVFS